jgi:sodium/hydrogen antiporter
LTSFDPLELSTIVGHLFALLMKFAQEKRLLDRESYIAQYVAVALFTVGATNSLGNDDLLAAFAAGTLSLTMLCADAYHFV